ncbi:AGE family epimerase/isomerase [Undibacterium fentianense]|uniref:AGE family epimerase/isomerase n=1 Tax=Undibacterium fentianense TaxID=2828728 RepID=A0A941E4M0_9BURK|nr:AGE family epimerase/isomerase [Undibacterium fentianense]MBR7799663.1 AGE family epimerase/isomerase [Undibacterium fentianense]
MSKLPDFRDARTLTAHIAQTMHFYHPRCIDPSGGFYHYFKNDGLIYDPHRRHLVSSSRFIFNYAMAYRHFKNPEYLEQVRHGLAFLREVHRNSTTGAYAWQLDWINGEKHLIDANNHCYGLAFVLLAYAHALMAGVSEARDYLYETVYLMEEKFWQAQHGLYADQASDDWQTLDPYRGQNANMHSCEAMIAAFQATDDLKFLHRAERIAQSITCKQASLAEGLIWEHYHSDWTIDWNYNLHDKANLFRPWGFQPGHFTEWAKLLMLLEEHSVLLQSDSTWLVPTAENLFNVAMQTAWDPVYGGICYGFAPDRTICDGDKYFWVQAESLAAAAYLAKHTGKQIYWEWYQKIWAYSWQHLIDHNFGAWYRILSRDNRQLSDEKSPAGKTDYHTMGACYEVLRLVTA